MIEQLKDILARDNDTIFTYSVSEDPASANSESEAQSTSQSGTGASHEIPKYIDPTLAHRVVYKFQGRNGGDGAANSEGAATSDSVTVVAGSWPFLLYSLTEPSPAALIHPIIPVERIVETPGSDGMLARKAVIDRGVFGLVRISWSKW